MFDGLVLWYKFDESTGSAKVRDEISNILASVNGATTFTPQRYNNGAMFDGSSGYIQVPSTFVMPSVFTIRMVVTPTSWVSNARILDWQDAGPTNGITFVQNGSSGNVGFTTRNGSTQTASLVFGVLTNGQKYDLIITHDGTIATAYLNGVQCDQDTSAQFAAAATQITFARRAPSASNFFAGGIDDFRIYNRVLTQAEITSLANGGGFYTTVTKMQKRYEYKVYSKEGQYVATWTDVINEPQFTTVINGGYVQMLVQLARQTDSFGEEVDVKFGNEVQLWCFDGDAPNGTKIFTGYISRYDPRNDGPEDKIQVYILGYHQTLKDYMYENSVGETQIAQNSKDPGKIAEDILNSVGVLGCQVTFDEITLQKTGTVVSYTFQGNTAQESIDKVLELSPVNWYWYVDANKKLNMHPKQDGAVHTFVVGREIFYMEPAKRIENVINRIYFTGGIPVGETTPLYSRYERQASIQQYGLKSVKRTDQRILLQSTMDTIANNILDSFQDIEVRTVIRVKDNDFDTLGYDIESIKVGDTCQIRNYQDSFNSSKWDVMLWDTDYWDFNLRNLTELVMQIVEINYQPNYVELTISSKIPNVAKRIEDVNRNLVDTITLDNPVSPDIGVDI